jgi:hypothetical protein
MVVQIANEVETPGLKLSKTFSACIKTIAPMLLTHSTQIERQFQTILLMLLPNVGMYFIQAFQQLFGRWGVLLTTGQAKRLRAQPIASSSTVYSSC